jgi:hypothetical protein
MNSERALPYLAALGFGGAFGSLIGAANDIIGETSAPSIIVFIIPFSAWFGAGLGLRVDSPKTIRLIALSWASSTAAGASSVLWLKDDLVAGMAVFLLLLFVLVSGSSPPLLIPLISAGGSLVAALWRYTIDAVPDLGDLLRGPLIPHLSLFFGCALGAVQLPRFPISLGVASAETPSIIAVAVTACVGAARGVPGGAVGVLAAILLWWVLLLVGGMILFVGENAKRWRIPSEPAAAAAVTPASSEERQELAQV